MPDGGAACRHLSAAGSSLPGPQRRTKVVLMDPADIATRARGLLERYRLPGTEGFLVGTFDTGITVLSQQVRALNLVWALIESGQVPLDDVQDELTEKQTTRQRIAVVGGGFAGLTVAAGLLKKRVNADITLFERRDTVLPLQHGSDSRWLHPHIYDWPKRGSEAYSAALPLMNWTASRASDVVVQVLRGWGDVVGNPQAAPEMNGSEPPGITVYCNTQHLQVSKPTSRPRTEHRVDRREA